MNIPQELKAVRGWLTWRYVQRPDEGKPRKVPFYVSGGARRGKQGSAEDRQQLASYDDAVAAATRRGMNGVGLALLPEWGITALDFDNCIDDGRILPGILPLVTDTYAEISPSGNGVRAFYLGAAGDHKAPANDLYPFGFETFTAKGFVTVTGRGLGVDELAGPYLATLPDAVRQHCRERFGEGFDRARAVTKPDPDRAATDLGKVREALFTHDPSCSEPEWFRILAAVHYETNGSPEGLALATEWSSGGKNYTGASSVKQRWDRFDLSHDEPRTLASLRKDRPATPDDFDVIEDVVRERLNDGSTPIDVDVDSLDAPAVGPLDDFYAHLPDHRYIHRPTGALWPAASVDGEHPGLKMDGNLKPSAWLDARRSVHQITWDPAMPEIVENRIVKDGGWVSALGQRVYNRYKRPFDLPGDAALAAPWVNHVEKLYQDEAAHIIAWLAHRVQYPGEKINHALVLGGNPGSGKDTLIECVKPSVGEANFKDINPGQMVERWNDWCMAVLVKINEANDRSGEFDRWKFYEHSKQFFAAPPTVLRVDQKHIQQFPVFNVAGYILTTNHKVGALFLPADDRRHYVAWSDMTRDQMGGQAYFDGIYEWMRTGGWGHVQAFLRRHDISSFDAKAPPPQTPAFFDMVAGGKSDEEVQLSEALEALDSPPVFTLQQLEFAAPALTLKGGSNQKLLHMLRRAGYDRFDNPDNRNGRWSLRIGPDKQNVTVYARLDVPPLEKVAACRDLINSLKGTRDE